MNQLPVIPNEQNFALDPAERIKKMSMYHTEIHVKGKINPSWSDWFGELEMRETSSDETILVGELPDMSAVYGVISRLGSLVIPLVSVHCTKEVDECESRPGAMG